MHRMKIEFPADNQRLGRMLYALAHCPVSPEFSIEYTVEDPEASKNELLGNAVKDSMKKASVLAGSTISSYYKAEVNHDMPQFAG